MKKYLLPFIGISTGFVIAIPFLSSCASPRNETQVMMDLYKNNKEYPVTISIEKSAYFSLWTSLAQSNETTEGIANINWCLEYSLFQHFILGEGCQFTTGISLNANDSIYEHISNGGITPTFRTTIGSVEFVDANNLKFNYTGYLQLNVTRQIDFANGKIFNANDSIQIIYTFTNFVFDISYIGDPSSEQFFTEVIKATVPGNDILTINVSQDNNLFLKSFSEMPNAGDINIPNYFQAKQI